MEQAIDQDFLNPKSKYLLFTKIESKLIIRQNLKL